MEKFTLQLPSKRPTSSTTKPYLTILFSVFTLGTVVLVYFNFRFIDTHLLSMFHKDVESNANASTMNAPAVAAVDPEAATALTFSPTSNVGGKKFDRFVTIWLENQDYDIAAGDPNLQWVASQGITLTNFAALTHPSQPNYVASVGGSTHGVWGDQFSRVPRSVRTLADLFDDASVSWALYQEDMPYTGFQGNWVNQRTGANMYVRKHNPLMSYDSCTMNPGCLARSKNFTLFYEDLENDALPQWMFITPNMTNDGHDSSVTTAGVFMRRFLEPLLSDSRFMKNTLILLTFDETERYFIPNIVFSVLLGDAVPTSAWGTSDDTSYDHYSMATTVENNWDLGNLGLNDMRATRFY